MAGRARQAPRCLGQRSTMPPNHGRDGCRFLLWNMPPRFFLGDLAVDWDLCSKERCPRARQEEGEGLRSTTPPSGD